MILTRGLMCCNLVNTFRLALYENKRAIFRTRASLLCLSLYSCVTFAYRELYFSGFLFSNLVCFLSEREFPVCWMTHCLSPAAVCQEENPQSTFTA